MKTLIAIALVLGTASTVLANETGDFLGDAKTWTRARIEMPDIHPLFGGASVALEGSGGCFVQVVDHGKNPPTSRHELAIPEAEARAIFERCVADDLLAVKFRDRVRRPDEAPRVLVLVNADGVRRPVLAFHEGRPAAFAATFDAVHALIARAAKTEPRETLAFDPYDSLWYPVPGIDVALVVPGQPGPGFEVRDHARVQRDLVESKKARRFVIRGRGGVAGVPQRWTYVGESPLEGWLEAEAKRRLP